MLDWRNRNFIGKDNRIKYEAIIGSTESEISAMDEMIKDILLARKQLNSFCKSVKKEQKFFKKHREANMYKYNWHGTPPFEILNLLIARLEMNIQKMKGK